MPPTLADVAVIGGGLSGLMAALLLEQQGTHDVALFEARPGLGGRIASMDAAGAPVDCATPALDRFDLGPTWFWPDYQPQLARLVRDLGLTCFEQYDRGDMLIERFAGEPALRRPGLRSAPASVRLSGGTGALIAALHERLDARRIHVGHAVRRLHRAADHVELEVENARGEIACWRARQVLLALPPRLAASRLAFEPALPAELLRDWLATPTWMAPHAKYVAVYERPFWRDMGLSGDAQSRHGPLVEIHDVSMPGGHAALFGFVGVPATARRGLPAQVLQTHCREQFARLFGPAAAHPLADGLKDWAADPLTATDADQDAAGHHVAAPPARPASGPWSACLAGIGSEWSAEYPGYLAGAVDAAARGVRAALGASA